MISTVRENVVSAHEAAIAQNGENIGIIIIIICVISLPLCVPNVTKKLTLAQDKFNCMVNMKEEL